MRASSPRNRGSSRGALLLLSLDQNGNNSTSIQTERTMPQNPQDGADFSRMRGHGNIGFPFAGLAEEYLRESLGTTRVLGVASLGRNTVPEVVFLGEAGLNRPVREHGVNVGLAVAVVAGVDANTLAEEFFDNRGEGGRAAGQVQAIEGEIGGLEGTGQRADDVGVGSVHSLFFDELLPEVVGNKGLGFAGWG